MNAAAPLQKLLFVCCQNRLRSLTAVHCAGLGGELSFPQPLRIRWPFSSVGKYAASSILLDRSSPSPRFRGANPSSPSLRG